MDANQQIAHFVSQNRWEDLPAQVQEKARMCFVDNLGAAIAGTQTRVSQICAEYAQASHALGIAEYHAPNAPMMRDVDHPAMVKHAIPWGSLTGVTAAQLAARGFSGIPLLFGEARYQDWVLDIGNRYLMPEGVAWKMKGYACCAWAHAAAQGARELVVEHGIALDQIESIVVDAFNETVRLGTRLPATTEEAQFNLAWPVAAMLVDGEIGPRQTGEQRLQDPGIQNLARRVAVVESEVLNELCRLHAAGDPRGRFASIVTIKLKDGREYCSGMKDGGLKFPAPQWTREMMTEKFRWLATTVLDDARVDELLDMAWRLDELSRVKELTARLS